MVRTLNETNADTVNEAGLKLSQITKVGFIEKLKDKAKQITSKRIITEEWEPLEMKGSIIDYIP